MKLNLKHKTYVEEPDIEINEITRDDLIFILDISDNGLANEEENKRYEEIREKIMRDEELILV